MDAEREKLIRDHWREHGHKFDFSKQPRWRVAVLRPWTAGDMRLRGTPISDAMETLEFCLDHGEFEGRPARRIICEGIELARVVR